MNITPLSSPAAQSASSSASTSTRVAAAEGIYPEPEEGLDPTKATVISGRTIEEQAEFDYRVVLEHRNRPWVESDQALTTIEKGINSIQKELRSQRPDLADAGWDVTIKAGKLKVIGDLSDSDKALIEGKLNKSGTMRAAVDTYVKAAVTYLETTDENPAYRSNNRHSGKVQSYEFHDVAQRLEGKIAFRELIAGAANRYGGAQVVDQTRSGGYYSLEMLADQLS